MSNQLTELINKIDEEIHRSKKFANSTGNNGSGIGVIVRSYRQALKEYRKIVSDDRADGVESYYDIK